MIARPPIVSREQWGARDPTGPMYGFTPSGAIVHHTAGANGVFSFERECEIQRAMQRQHINQGWGDLGVHGVVYQSGRIFAGRPFDIRGVHSPAANAWALSIEFQGIFTDQMPTDAQWDAAVWLYAWMAQEAGFDAGHIWGHRDWTATACPGNQFYAALDAFRAEVAAFSGSAPVTTKEADVSTVDYRLGQGGVIETPVRVGLREEDGAKTRTRVYVRFTNVSDVAVTIRCGLRRDTGELLTSWDMVATPQQTCEVGKDQAWSEVWHRAAGRDFRGRLEIVSNGPAVVQLEHESVRV